MRERKKRRKDGRKEGRKLENPISSLTYYRRQLPATPFYECWGSKPGPCTC
jgi:hypothetical protein